MTNEIFESWGRYPKYKHHDMIRLYWRNEIPDLDKLERKVLPYGCGKSYGDSCLNENGILIGTRGLNHFISFDEENGTFKCEAGVTLAEILDFIVPRGWFLGVTPGTKYCTVGGALANDVHGKNHHIGGTFGCQTREFELLRSDGERLVCSPEENPDLFRATIGGLGLTGLITWIEFNIKPCPSPFIAMESIKYDSLEEFFEISRESDENFDYTVAWVDCTATGSNIGRGIFTRGNHASPEDYDLPKLNQKEPKTFPFDAPFINSCSVNLFNMLYFNKQLNHLEKKIVHYDEFFYPLDSVNDWNKAYGKNGFLQYQFVVPFGNELNTIRTILKKVSGSGLSSFLTVLKTFGDLESHGMLSFPSPGVTMAIDFRFSGQKTLKILEELDDIVRTAGGKIYPAKDARMSGKDFKSFYSNLDEFRQYIDPKFSSSFWRRVTDGNS